MVSPQNIKHLKKQKTMQWKQLIIDGYNLLHQIPELARMVNRDREGARHCLVRQIETAACHMAEKTVIVFDGRESGSDATLTSKYIQVVYSPGHMSADTVIERMVFEARNPLDIMVITSDSAERTAVSSAGALTMSCREFLDRCRNIIESNIRHPLRNRPLSGPRLGDFFPDALK